jgi:hypothetical protein
MGLRDGLLSFLSITALTSKRARTDENDAGLELSRESEGGADHAVGLPRNLGVDDGWADVQQVAARTLGQCLRGERSELAV